MLGTILHIKNCLEENIHVSLKEKEIIIDHFNLKTLTFTEKLGFFRTRSSI